MAHKNIKNYSPYKARQKDKTNLSLNELRGTHKKPEKIFSINEANDRLFDIFKNHQFNQFVTHEQRIELAHFYVLLMENQEKENFTRLLKIKDIAIKHFIDSIIVTQLTELSFPLMDIGTGPGFPGIPLKIFHKNEEIILAEGVQRRVQFLKEVRQKMNLLKLPILGRNINKYCLFPVNGVITRAVEDISNTLTNAQNCLQVGGKVFLMKGPGVDPEIELFKQNKILIEHYKLNEDISYNLPQTDQKRRLIVFEKIKNFEIPDDDPEDIFLLDELSRDEKQRWSQF